MQVSNKMVKKDIGKVAYNTKNEIIGRIADITQDVKNKPNYIILSCDKLKGFGSKYFAIPLNSAFVKITRGKMVLNIRKDDLKKAREIDFDKSLIENGNSILKNIAELIDYHSPFFRRVTKE